MLERKENPTDLYNPDIHDFEFEYCGDDGVKVKYTIKSLGVTSLPYYLAEHGANKLADCIYWKRGDNSHVYGDVIKEILKEILI